MSDWPGRPLPLPASDRGQYLDFCSCDCGWCGLQEDYGSGSGRGEGNRFQLPASSLGKYDLELSVSQSWITTTQPKR